MTENTTLLDDLLDVQLIDNTSDEAKRAWTEIEAAVSRHSTIEEDRVHVLMSKLRHAQAERDTLSALLPLYSAVDDYLYHTLSNSYPKGYARRDRLIALWETFRGMSVDTMEYADEGTETETELEKARATIDYLQVRIAALGTQVVDSDILPPPATEKETELREARAEIERLWGTLTQAQVDKELAQCGHLAAAQEALALRKAQAKAGRAFDWLWGFWDGNTLVAISAADREEIQKAFEQLANSIEEAAVNDYLVVVRYNFSADAWIIDEDSRHTLEDDSEGAAIKELRVCAIRDLWPTDEEAKTNDV